jgi:hypothetical protein
MNVAQFQQLLEQNGNATLQFELPDGNLIPPHFHVTEVGRVDKNFIDCGGTQRQSASCVLQVWTAEDLDHRLFAGKLAGILRLAQPILKSDDLPVELEYGVAVAAKYAVTNAMSAFGVLRFSLVGNQTDCLAKDKCGVNGCAPASGCC